MTPNTPAGGAVACCHCGAPCREEVLPRGGDHGWGDDKSRTVRRYAPPATVPLDAVLALVEADRALDAVLERDRLRREAGSMLRFTEEIEIARTVRNAALDELEALTREATK